MFKIKNLYEFLERQYEKDEKEITLDEFIESFIIENFGIGSLNEGLLDDEFLFYYEKSYRIDHQNKTVEFLFKEVKF